MTSSIDLDLAWGGYYASKDADSGRLSVFRLLDFNREAYHAALFGEEFDVPPTLEELSRLSPFIGHAPMDARALLGETGLRLLGNRPLTRADLEGYAYYLEAHEMTPADQDELIERILELARRPPLRLRLTLVDDELEVIERP